MRVGVTAKPCLAETKISVGRMFEAHARITDAGWFSTVVPPLYPTKPRVMPDRITPGKFKSNTS